MSLPVFDQLAESEEILLLTVWHLVCMLRQNACNVDTRNVFRHNIIVFIDSGMRVLNSA